MIVMKFGGTSIQDAASIERVVEIVRRHIGHNPIVVNSAMGKTTRKLLAVAQHAAAGKDKAASDKLADIRQYHYSLAEILIPHFQENETRKLLDTYFEDLHKLLAGLSILRELTLRSQDKILAYGELIATAIIAAVFRHYGINAALCDARNFIITNERFSRAEPILDLTYRHIYEDVHPLVESNSVPVIQGFIGSSLNGATTTLGFEGSDYTAALVGAALNAASIQIWKDVSGIMTTDPSIFTGAHTVKKISFAEAAELTFFGAKVLHPSTIEPARQQNIPVHIYNSRYPDATGTIITEQAKRGKNIIKSIAYKRPITVIHITSDNSIPSCTFLKSIFDILDRDHIASYVTTITEATIALAISATENFESFINEMKRLGTVTIIRDKATVSLVGENLRRADDFISRVFEKLEGVTIDMISYGASSINITFVVSESLVSTVIARLHDNFFTEIDPEIFE